MAHTLDLGRCGVHWVVVSTTIACEGDGPTAVGEALNTMDIGCWFLFGVLWGGRGSTMVDTGCIRGRFVLHLDCWLVLPAKLEGNPLRPLGVAHIGLDRCCMAHGALLVKP